MYATHVLLLVCATLTLVQLGAYGEHPFENHVLSYLLDQLNPKATIKPIKVHYKGLGLWKATRGSVALDGTVELNFINFNDAGTQPFADIEIKFHTSAITIKSYAFFLFLFSKSTYVTKNIDNRFLGTIRFNKEACKMSLTGLVVDYLELKNKETFCKWCIISLVTSSNKKKFMKAMELEVGETLKKVISSAMENGVIRGFMGC